MCGIFGIIATPSSQLNKELADKIVNKLFILSEARGKESAGIAIKNTATHKISVLKKSVAASKLIESAEYKQFYAEATADIFKNQNDTLSHSLALIAHARLVTNGTQENNNNNQPVIKNGAVAVHNGIITNVDELWKTHKALNRIFEVDTEILLSIVRANVLNNKSLVSAVQQSFSEIEGTASTAILQDDLNKVLVATNNGSLYYSINKSKTAFIFASEEYILKTAISELQLNAQGFNDVVWQEAGLGFEIDMTDLKINQFNLKATDSTLSCETLLAQDEVKNYSPDEAINVEEINKPKASILKYEHVRKKLQFNIDAIKQLKRCTKCLLPETFPFINYDLAGVCNYCHKYVVKNSGHKENEFKAMMEKYKSKDGKPDCIIPFSGGRDSSYGMHYIVHELGMKPITYTYDWGMVTDLARRNIARVCGKLGIENILVSADLHMKRKNIKLNVEAWLKRPSLGIIPLFMAGDKQFFYYVNQIKKQTGIKLDIWSTNHLENTDFKVGFCGISPSFDKHRPDYLPLSSKIKMAGYYGKEFLLNPSYINSSVGDTLASFYSYYAEPRTHFYQLFDWVTWDEQKIEKTLFEEYNWEISPDTTSTWRIGDGTAAFYNYIYYTVAGFSEFDTFRSNQIREGLITREQGLEFIYKENLPRFESMNWYFETIGVDLEKAIDVVNKIPKRYKI